MKAIDVHNHFYPPSYLKALKEGSGAAKVAEDADGNYILSYEGDYNVIVPGHRDIAYRLEVIEEAGIEAQVLSLTTPGVHIEEKNRGIALAKKANNDFAEIAKKYPGRFYALAALPLQAPEAAAEELERSVKELGLKGGTLFTNVDGKMLDDPSFEPIFQKAEELDVPLFLHPTTPKPADNFLDYRLAATLGFAFDTTLAVARLIFSGLLDRVPGVKLVASHLGGCLPYLAERLDRGYEAFPECKGVSKPPSAYIAEVYIDCVSFNPLAVDFARKVVGADHMMAGSDYPHQIGSLTKCTAVIEALSALASEKEKILSGNAKALFKM